VKPVLVVMAAGASRRYGGLKQLEPVGPGGETLLEYAAFDARRAGCDAVVLVVRAETEASFRERLDAGLGRHAELTYVHQSLEHPGAPPPGARRAKPWGTAHAVLAAEPAIDGPFVVLNADDLYGAEPVASVVDHLRAGGARPAQVVVGFEVGRTLSPAGPVSRALCRVDDRGRLRGIVEIGGLAREGEVIRYVDADGADRSLGGAEPVSMNLWGFTPTLFPVLRRRFAEFLETPAASREGELLLPDVIGAAIAAREIEVDVLRTGADWCGMTWVEDLPRVRKVLRGHVASGRYPERLWD
jgi:dTDP-glucose pyrophosphorylase